MSVVSKTMRLRSMTPARFELIPFRHQAKVLPSVFFLCFPILSALLSLRLAVPVDTAVVKFKLRNFFKSKDGGNSFENPDTDESRDDSSGGGGGHYAQDFAAQSSSFDR